MNKRVFIAERKLLFSPKGKQERRPITIRVSAPSLIEQGSVNFRFDEGTAVCTIEFEGLGEESVDVHGADSIQALLMAADIDRYLKGMKRRYDFYFPNGEPYFEDV